MERGNERILEESELVTPSELEKLPTEMILKLMSHMDGKTFFKFRGASKLINNLFLAPDGKSDNMHLVVNTLSVWLRKFLTDYEVTAGYEIIDVLNIPPHTTDNLPSRFVDDRRYDFVIDENNRGIRAYGEIIDDILSRLKPYSRRTVDMNNSDEIDIALEYKGPELLSDDYVDTARMEIQQRLSDLRVGKKMEGLMTSFAWGETFRIVVRNKIVELVRNGKERDAYDFMRLAIIRSRIAVYPRFVIHDVLDLRHLDLTPREVLNRLANLDSPGVYELPDTRIVRRDALSVGIFTDVYDTSGGGGGDFLSGFGVIKRSALSSMSGSVNKWWIQYTAIINLIDFMYRQLYYEVNRGELSTLKWDEMGKSFVLLFSLHTLNRDRPLDVSVARRAYDETEKAMRLIFESPIAAGGVNEEAFINTRWIGVMSLVLDMIMWAVRGKPKTDELLKLRAYIKVSMTVLATDMRNTLYSVLLSGRTRGISSSSNIIFNLAAFPVDVDDLKDPEAEAKKLIATHLFFTGWKTV